MSLGKKISAGAVFALTIIDIIMGILRNSSVLCQDIVTWNDAQLCVDMNIITGVIEPSLAVIVCALPAYRAIMPSSRKRRYESLELRYNAGNVGHATPQQAQSDRVSESKVESSGLDPRMVDEL